MERNDNINISINRGDLGSLIICALRYCHGRKTYMPRLVQEITCKYINELADVDIDIILQDKRFQEDMKMFGNDQLEWLAFYSSVENEKKLRNNKD